MPPVVWMKWAVHPHSRGEHNFYPSVQAHDFGSSPLAWGTPDSPDTGRPLGRFIPTRVGNTHTHEQESRQIAVHPHSRGEHPPILCQTIPKGGSSPLAWGTLRSQSFARVLDRFIPTRVGNTHDPFGPIPQGTVHPHSRGEHVDLILVGLLGIGSSPLAWGTRRVCGVRSLRFRFIPTRVGNTMPRR